MPLGQKRDVVGLLRGLERNGEDNIWRVAKQAREEIEMLRSQLDDLLYAAKQAIPESEYPADPTPSNWAWQIRNLGDDRRAAYRLLARHNAELKGGDQ